MSQSSKKYLASLRTGAAASAYGSSANRRHNFLSGRADDATMDVSASMAPIPIAQNDYSTFNEENTATSLIKTLLNQEEDS